MLPSGLLEAASRFNVLSARPALMEPDFQFIQGSQGHFSLDWEGGTEFNFAYRPLEGSRRRIIDRTFLQHFFGGFGITDWFSVALDMPVAWNLHFQDPVPDNAPGFTNNFDLGDLKLAAKLNILLRYKKPVGLAFVPYLHIPTGNPGHFMGDESILGGGIFALDAEFAKRFVLAFNTGFEVTEGITFSNVQLSPAQLLIGAGAILRVIPDRLDINLEMKGRTPFGHLFADEEETPIEILGGMEWRSSRGLAIGGGMGVGVVYGVGVPAFRGLMRVSYAPLREESRQKRKTLQELKYGVETPPAVEWAVFDLKAKCPERAEEFDPKVHDPGCSKYYELSQLASLSLKCPSRLEDFDPKVHDAGCPKVYELRRDLTEEEYATVYVLAAQGLAGRCPDDPATFDPAKHDQACPKFFEIKQTVSLVARCPERPDDFDPNLHDADCPKVFTLRQDLAKRDIQAIRVLSQSDADQDGILDIADRCPRVFGIAAAHGCPEAELLFKQGQILTMRVPITFAYNKGELTPSIGRSLNEVAEVMINHPEIKIVRIEGHADSRGSARGNLKISLRRAEMVKRFLIRCGVAPARLKAIGIGEAKPIASNKTAAGRAKNRRATVLVLELVQ